MNRRQLSVLISDNLNSYSDLLLKGMSHLKIELLKGSTYWWPNIKKSKSGYFSKTWENFFYRENKAQIFSLIPHIFGT